MNAADSKPPVIEYRPAFRAGYAAGKAALARLFTKYVKVQPRVMLPNPHHAGGRSRTGGIPWVGNRRRAA